MPTARVALLPFVCSNGPQQRDFADVARDQLFFF